ncbi:MAG: hypothetical protein ACN6PW_02840 [Pseudomonas kermanshahensis]|uniref:hypothetical protein n=1 Tax=Pseudomonas kermanshahensis TaxID=2745482 RepID=UPI003D113603
MDAGLSQDKQAVGLRVALRILSGWNATSSQARIILRISASTHQKFLRDTRGIVRLDIDQLQRLSLVLNIHATLRILFENIKNTQDFINMPNFNSFFEGRSPLEVIAQGDIISLYETYRHIQSLHLDFHPQPEQT